MATTKTRINVSVSKEVEKAVKALAKRDQVPNATKAAELLRLALEVEEDYVFDLIAQERDADNTTYISHKTAWK